jgi:zinc D-Ala-D-Ala dipeptidase
MRIATFILMITLFSCSENNNKKNNKDLYDEQNNQTDSVIADTTLTMEELVKHYEDTSFVDIEELSNDFSFEIVYSSEDNYFEKKFYPCAKCYLRYEAALALINANKELSESGYKLKLFDCFRPFSVQKQMWETLPDSRYVANPNRGGSIHNKGAAVDVGLVDTEGKDIPMGTDFDFFGPESAHNYFNIDSVFIANRKTLRKAMENNGFVALETEWWHYTFVSEHKYKNADIVFVCD